VSVIDRGSPSTEPWSRAVLGRRPYILEDGPPDSKNI
jgi:hypothetical protein